MRQRSSIPLMAGVVRRTPVNTERRDCHMPKLVATHEVDDVAHWLASPKRKEVFASLATNITTFVHPSDPHRVALFMDVADMNAFNALMKSDAAAAAMKYDGVRPDTLVVYQEG
jgi:hypothetical protein